MLAPSALILQAPRRPILLFKPCNAHPHVPRCRSPQGFRQLGMIVRRVSFHTSHHCYHQPGANNLRPRNSQVYVGMHPRVSQLLPRSRKQDLKGALRLSPSESRTGLTCASSMDLPKAPVMPRRRIASIPVTRWVASNNPMRFILGSFGQGLHGILNRLS